MRLLVMMVATVACSISACASDAEDRAAEVAEERVEAEAEARGEQGLETDLREIGAGEVAEFEEERESGEHLGQRVYDETPRKPESEDPLREAILTD